MILPLIYGALVGLSLALTGGGGSILAVPLLLYGLGLPLREAVTVSLAVVGLTALYGAVVQRRQALWKAGGVLGVGGVFGAPLGAWVGGWLPDNGTLLLFALLMGFMGYRMWRGNQASDVPLSFVACRREPGGALKFHWPCAGKLAVAGLLTGVLAGIFGVGGGFLVVPALMLVAALPMDRALPTSLVGIAWISAAAFVFNYKNADAFPIGLAGLFLAGSAVGMSVGTLVKQRLSDVVLKKTFAGVISGVSLWMLIKTFIAFTDVGQGR